MAGSNETAWVQHRTVEPCRNGTITKYLADRWNAAQQGEDRLTRVRLYRVDEPIAGGVGTRSSDLLAAGGRGVRPEVAMQHACQPPCASLAGRRSALALALAVLALADPRFDALLPVVFAD